MKSNLISPTQITTILVDGATGYVGSHLVYALNHLGSNQPNIRCLVRQNANVKDLDFLRITGSQIIEGNLQNNTDLDEAFSQVDVACHLIGSIAPRRGETSSQLHVQQTKHFIEYCLRAKVKKIIMVSACGADPNAKSEYHRTKWQAEELIKNCGIPAVILRPSLIIGRSIGNRNSKLIIRLENLIRNKKKVPLIAGGKNNVQPIFIDDLIEAIITCIFSTSYPAKGTVIELGGPEILTLKELAMHLMSILRIKKPFLNLPVFLAFPIAIACQLVQKVPLISKDQVILSQQDNICSNNQLQKLIRRNPTSVIDALNSYKSIYE